MAASKQHWLMKAEPESRMEKGVDVAFSVDHFEKIKTTTWDGVRNPEAKTIMKDKMKLHDEVLFYHSNCALPGVAALAEVSREGYPDHTAWDPKHPYYDPKTDKENPKWFMVDCTFRSRLPHFVSLALLQHITSSALTPEQKKEIPYLKADHIKAIASMPLLSRGRLSVQPVPPLAYEGIVLLGTKGGFSAWPGKWNKSASRGKRKSEAAKPANPEAPADEESGSTSAPKSASKKARTSTDRKVVPADNEGEASTAPTQGRRSARLKQ